MIRGPPSRAGLTRHVLRPAPSSGRGLGRGVGRYLEPRVPARWQCWRRMARQLSGFSRGRGLPANHRAGQSVGPQPRGRSADNSCTGSPPGRNCPGRVLFPDIAAAQPMERKFCPVPGITQFMGGTPAEQPERYCESSATLLLPIGVPQTIVAGGLLQGAYNLVR